MKKRNRRKFSKEFNAEACRLMEHRKVKDVAESLGVLPSVLTRWRAEQTSQGSDAFRGNGKRTELEEELYQAKRRIRELEEEQEILKKASAYFAKHLQ